MEILPEAEGTVSSASVYVRLHPQTLMSDPLMQKAFGGLRLKTLIL